MAKLTQNYANAKGRSQSHTPKLLQTDKMPPDNIKSSLRNRFQLDINTLGKQRTFSN